MTSYSQAPNSLLSESEDLCQSLEENIGVRFIEGERRTDLKDIAVQAGPADQDPAESHFIDYQAGPLRIGLAARR